MLLGPYSLRFSSAQQTSDGLLSRHGNGRKPSPLFLQSLCAWQGIKRAVVPQPLLVPPLVPPLATTLDNTGQRWTDQRYVAKKTLLLLTPPLRALFSNLAPLHSSRFLLIRLLIRFIHPLIPASVPHALATHNKETRLVQKARLFHQGSPSPATLVLVMFLVGPFFLSTTRKESNDLGNDPGTMKKESGWLLAPPFGSAELGGSG
jgi:hypothetical protein